MVSDLTAELKSGAKALSEERTWTNSEGKSLRGKLIESPVGEQSKVIVDGKIRLLVKGKVYTVALNSLEAVDRKYIAMAAKNHESPEPAFIPKSFEIELAVQVENSGTIKTYYGPIFPTFAQPQVILKEFGVPSMKRLDASTGKCSLAVRGNFYSSLSNLMQLTKPKFPLGRVYVNGSKSAVASFKFELSDDQNKARSIGTFSQIIDDVPVTEGLNTIEFVVADALTSIEGSRKTTFNVQLNPGVPIVDNLKISKPKSDGAGEHSPFLLVVNGVSDEEANGLHLCIGEGDERVVCKLQKISKEGSEASVRIAKSFEANSILRFSLLPSRKKFDIEKAKTAMQLIGRIIPVKNMSDRDIFLTGYSKGVFINGADLLTTGGTIISSGATFTPETYGLELKLYWEKDNKRGNKFTLPLSYKFLPKDGASAGLGDSPELLWEIAQLFRANDPKSQKVTSALVNGDLESIGIKGIELDGWREKLITDIAEIIHDLNGELKEAPLMLHGFVIGMAVGAACQVELPPFPDTEGQSKPWVRPSKEEVLGYVVKMIESTE